MVLCEASSVNQSIDTPSPGRSSPRRRRRKFKRAFAFRAQNSSHGTWRDATWTSTSRPLARRTQYKFYGWKSGTSAELPRTFRSGLKWVESIDSPNQRASSQQRNKTTSLSPSSN